MESLEFSIARELAEEIRTNTKLRHRLGMDEGSESGVLGGTEANQIGLTDREGNTFFITVDES